MSEHDLDLPSGRIRFMLEAVRQAEDDSRFHVDMRVFHGYYGRNELARNEKVCIACAAGMAAIKRWNNMEPIGVVERVDVASIFNIDVDELVQFEDSLDYARCGDIEDMLVVMGWEVRDGFPQFGNVAYEDDPIEWRAWMNVVADELEADWDA